jgi:hypothetical protein
MKKLLGILVLGLLLSGNAYTEAVFTQQEIDKDIKYMNEFYNQKVLNSNDKLCVLAQSTNVYETIWGYACGPKSMKNKIIKTALKECQANGENCIITRQGVQIVNQVAQKVSKDKNINIAGNNMDIAETIQKAKDTCKSLGFKEGTEKFTDCSLKLYSQSLDLAAKQNQQVVIQNQGSSSGTVKMFDVVRDRENSMRKAKGLIDGSCTLANYVFC